MIFSWDVLLKYQTFIGPVRPGCNSPGKNSTIRLPYRICEVPQEVSKKIRQYVHRILPAFPQWILLGEVKESWIELNGSPDPASNKAGQVVVPNFLGDPLQETESMEVAREGLLRISPLSPLRKTSRFPQKSENLLLILQVSKSVFPGKPAKGSLEVGNRLLPTGWIAP
jgi:hypothetical protein